MAASDGPHGWSSPALDHVLGYAGLSLNMVSAGAKWPRPRGEGHRWSVHWTDVAVCVGVHSRPHRATADRAGGIDADLVVRIGANSFGGDIHTGFPSVVHRVRRHDGYQRRQPSRVASVSAVCRRGAMLACVVAVNDADDL